MVLTEETGAFLCQNALIRQGRIWVYQGFTTLLDFKNYYYLFKTLFLFISSFDLIIRKLGPQVS